VARISGRVAPVTVPSMVLIVPSRDCDCACDDDRGGQLYEHNSDHSISCTRPCSAETPYTFNRPAPTDRVAVSVQGCPAW